MNPKKLAAATAIAAGVGMSALTSGAGVVNAAPLAPRPPTGPETQWRQDPFEPEPSPGVPIPAEKCWRYGRSGGGTPRGGGGMPGYLPQCPGAEPAEPPPG
jgi:hypothetical protein